MRTRPALSWRCLCTAACRYDGAPSFAPEDIIPATAYSLFIFYCYFLSLPGLGLTHAFARSAHTCDSPFSPFPLFLFLALLPLPSSSSSLPPCRPVNTTWATVLSHITTLPPGDYVATNSPPDLSLPVPYWHPDIDSAMAQVRGPSAKCPAREQSN